MPGSSSKAVVPLVQLDSNLFALELFHGPTLAFKDLALQLAGHLFEYVLASQDRRVRIVGATSGDTGSAAIEAMAGPREYRHHHPAPGGQNQRGAAPADDHRAGRQRAEHRG